MCAMLLYVFLCPNLFSFVAPLSLPVLFRRPFLSYPPPSFTLPDLLMYRVCSPYQVPAWKFFFFSFLKAYATQPYALIFQNVVLMYGGMTNSPTGVLLRL